MFYENIRICNLPLSIQFQEKWMLTCRFSYIHKLFLLYKTAMEDSFVRQPFLLAVCGHSLYVSTHIYYSNKLLNFLKIFSFSVMLGLKLSDSCHFSNAWRSSLFSFSGMYMLTLTNKSPVPVLYP